MDKLSEALKELTRLADEPEVALAMLQKLDEKAVLRALEAAARNDIGTSGPFTVKTVRTR